MWVTAKGLKQLAIAFMKNEFDMGECKAIYWFLPTVI